MSQTWIPAQTFGTRLAMVRRHLGWNIKEAASRTGLDDGSWSNWERGALPRNMAEVVERIHQETGADRDWLMWGSEAGATLATDERSGSSVGDDEQSLPAIAA